MMPKAKPKESPEEKEQKPKTIVFLQPFPNLTESRFHKLVALVQKDNQKKTPQGVSPSGLDIKYQIQFLGDTPERTTYAKYIGDIKLLERNTRIHIKGILRSHRLEGEKEPNIKILKLPKDQKSLAEVQEELSKLKNTDELYINAHGNVDLIAIGCFTMNPKSLAINLKSIGLRQESPPHISIWACNSGLSYEGRTTFVARLGRCLTNKGFQHVSIAGTRSFLHVDSNTRARHTFVAEHSYENGKLTLKKLRPSESLSFFLTPRSKEKSKSILKSPRTPYRQNLLLSKMKDEPITPLKAESPEVDPSQENKPKPNVDTQKKKGTGFSVKRKPLTRGSPVHTRSSPVHTRSRSRKLS